MSIPKKFLPSLILSLAIPSFAFAEIVLQAFPGNPDSVYRNGAPAVFRFLVTKDGKPCAAAPLTCEIERESFLPREARTLSTGSDGYAELQVKPGKPGCIRVRATVSDSAGKPVAGKAGKNISRRIGAMIDPEKIDTALAEPPDFDDFWNRARRELAATPPAVLSSRELPPPAALRSKIRGFDLQIAAPGPKPVSGILALPANAQKASLPAILLLHGAGVRSSKMPAYQAVHYRALVFDINAHGLPNGKPSEFYNGLLKGELKGYIYRPALDDPEKGYFRYMFLRELRALEYLRSRPEWDGHTLIVCGNSQGGAQALAAAGLDPKVTYCLAGIPWLTAPAAPAEGRFQPNWPRLLHLDSTGKVRNPEAIRRLGYCDAANFAKRMKAECSIKYGMIDEVCPPSGVWITFNRISGRKMICGDPAKGHQSIPGGDGVDDYLKRVRATRNMK